MTHYREPAARIASVAWFGDAQHHGLGVSAALRFFPNSPDSYLIPLEGPNYSGAGSSRSNTSTSSNRSTRSTALLRSTRFGRSMFKVQGKTSLPYISTFRQLPKHRNVSIAQLRQGAATFFRVRLDGPFSLGPRARRIAIIEKSLREAAVSVEVTNNEAHEHENRYSARYRKQPDKGPERCSCSLNFPDLKDIHHIMPIANVSSILNLGILLHRELAEGEQLPCQLPCLACKSGASQK